MSGFHVPIGKRVLVPGHKYPKTGIKEIYGKTSVRVCAPIQMIPLHFRVLMAWDKYGMPCGRCPSAGRLIRAASNPLFSGSNITRNPRPARSVLIMVFVTTAAVACSSDLGWEARHLHR